VQRFDEQLLAEVKCLTGKFKSGVADHSFAILEIVEKPIAGEFAPVEVPVIIPAIAETVDEEVVPAHGAERQLHVSGMLERQINEEFAGYHLAAFQSTRNDRRKNGLLKVVPVERQYEVGRRRVPQNGTPYGISLRGGHIMEEGVLVSNGHARYRVTPREARRHRLEIGDSQIVSRRVEGSQVSGESREVEAPGRGQVIDLAARSKVVEAVKGRKRSQMLNILQQCGVAAGKEYVNVMTPQTQSSDYLRGPAQVSVAGALHSIENFHRVTLPVI
jgi:hypothetical protein